MNEKLWCIVCRTLTTHTYKEKYKAHNLGLWFTCTICKNDMLYVCRTYRGLDLTEVQARTLKDAIELVELWSTT